MTHCWRPSRVLFEGGNGSYHGQWNSRILLFSVSVEASISLIISDGNVFWCCYIIFSHPHQYCLADSTVTPCHTYTHICYSRLPVLAHYTLKLIEYLDTAPSSFSSIMCNYLKKVWRDEFGCILRPGHDRLCA